MAGLTLRWHAPVNCPQQAEVRERIRALTGTMRTTTVLQAEGVISQTDSNHFHLKLVTRSGGLVGERSLDASSCENLTGAASVSLALLMRSAEPLSEGDLAGRPSNGTIGGTTTNGGSATTAGASTDGKSTNGGSTTAGGTGTDGKSTTVGGATIAGTEQTTGSSSTATPSQSNTGVVAPVAKKQPPSEAKRDSAEVPLSEIIERPIRPSPSERKRGVFAQLPLATLSLGPLPKPSWGLAFAGGASFDDWRLLLGGSVWLRQNVTSDQSEDVGADIDRFSGTFRACRVLEESRFEVAPCLVLSLEHISARGTGAGVTAHSEQASWLAVGAGAQGRLKLTPFLGLLLGLDAQIETARPVIAIDGVGDLRQLGPAAFTVTVGPEWIL